MTSSLAVDRAAEAARPRTRIARLEAVLGESVLDWVPGLGASLAVTPTRVVVLRQGAERRPRTGLRAWAHGEIDARLDPPRGGHGRIVLGDGPNPYRAVSVFVPVTNWSWAVRSVETIRAQARRVGRSSRSRLVAATHRP